MRWTIINSIVVERFFRSMNTIDFIDNLMKSHRFHCKILKKYKLGSSFLDEV